MQLDPDTCYRAMASRDARFDGRFFAAVRTTGIYCRPICPARKPLRRNVDFYPSAAAAERAGFRPCRRCRPDASPGSPEWCGRSATLSRALRMIHEGALNGGSVETVAARLGVSARHLGRLFREHLGCSPLAMAQTVRTHFARKLIDETDLSMAEVAFGAGYRSVRRFNDAMKACFGQPPSALRDRARPRSGGGAAAENGSSLHLRLAYRPPLFWDHLLGFLGARAIPGVEVVEHGAYRRTVLQEGHVGWLEVRPGDEPHTLLLSTSLPATRGIQGVVRRVRNLFDLSADPLRIEQDLARDGRLSRALARCAGIRVPGAWDGFELAVRAILGQQVTVKGASTLLGRLVTAHGRPAETGVPGLEHVFPTPEALAAADLSDLGVPRMRATALSALAEKVVEGGLDLDPSADPELTHRDLCALPGVGRWTADYVVMRALCDPDAFPVDDLVLRRAASTDGEPLAPGQLAERSEAWRPWRAYAAMVLWKGAA